MSDPAFSASDPGSALPFAEEGSLREMKGQDIGTRRDIDANEMIRGRRLIDALQIRFVLQKFGPPATPQDHPPSAPIEIYLSPFSQFNASLAEQVLERISRNLTDNLEWGIKIAFETTNPTITGLLPRRPEQGAGVYAPDFRLSLADLLTKVEVGWQTLQMDLWTELEFRARYRIASKHASTYCHTQNWGWHRRNTQTELIQLWRDILPLYSILTRAYGLRSDISRDSGEPKTTAAYMNLAWLAIKKGNFTAAVDFLFAALPDAFMNEATWSTDKTTVRPWMLDVGAANSYLGRRERRLLRVCLKKRDVWHSVESARRRLSGLSSAVASEGLAIMRELAVWRAYSDGRILQIMDFPLREAASVRDGYLSRHRSNPYRKGLELCERFASQVWECLAIGGVTEEIIFGPVRISQRLIPPIVFANAVSGESAILPDMRLERLSRVQVPDTDDLEHALSAIYEQMETDASTSAALAIWYILAQNMVTWGEAILALNPERMRSDPIRLDADFGQRTIS
jgi:hypothetical protein